MARTMLNDSKLDDKLWVQAIDTTVFIINRGFLRNNCNMTSCDYGKEDRLMSNTSKYLEENATSKEKIKNWASSIPVSMKVFTFTQKERLIDATI